MNVLAERSKSLWLSTADLEKFPPLAGDDAADVVIVGGGIAGLSLAYELSLEGLLVMVLDRGVVGGGMTARTTAHLASAFDDTYHELIRVRGLANAQQAFASHAAAVARIEHIQQEEKIDCDFRRLDGYLFLAPDSDPSELEKEMDAAHRVGLAAKWVERTPLSGVDTGRSLCFPGQGRFHPLKYLNGLIQCIRARKGRIHGETCVTSIDEEDGQVLVSTESGAKIRARAVAVTTNSPINDRLAIHTKQAPYRTYVIAGHVPRGSVTDVLYWDTQDPYHYVRLQPGGEDGDFLVSGGEDHKSGEGGDMSERLDQLERWTRRRFPELGAITHRWSGQVLEPVDCAAFIGRNHGNTNVFVATGDSGQGITHGVIAGMLLRDLILDRPNAWVDLYDPGRVSSSAIGEFVKENVTMVQNLTEYIRSGEVDSVADIEPGQGAVVRSGLKRIAAYRDEKGRLHAHSAVCTHMGCVVQWNAFEQCWDCPCHGSHFAIEGTALNAPAVSPLGDAEVADAKEEFVGGRSDDR
jgi:glycine/D-amino acid oxidase-like deaminating enzyme/nitrite reductase/ring-hydroxylating ferredoxin subunit